MEVVPVAAIVNVIVQNLVEHGKKEISRVRGLEKETEKLAGSLDTIQKFLNDAEMSTVVPGEAVKSWLKKLEDVAFDADNVLDELSYHLLSKPIKSNPINIHSCFSSSNPIIRPGNMARKIKGINENLESIRTEAASLGLVQRLRDVPTLVDATSETDSYTLDPIFIGRDNVVSEIVEILTTSITTDERVISILAIVGMGGLGKTTLTRKVFNQLKGQTTLSFSSHIWVHVSQIFDPIVLFKKILKELTPYQVEAEMSRQDIMKRMEEVLKDKTYLLILDDVWNEDLPKWENFINSLLGVTSINGNAIVVTTRNIDVATTVNASHTSHLKELSNDDCWSIIKEKCFGKEDFPKEFETIGRKIAKRCHGLPLAANVVGGVLRNKSEEKWLSIEEKWLSRIEGDHITKILRLSFDNLSLPSLKECFAYCSIFPKGHKIERRKLIECWMAEGFLETDGSNDDMECVGDRFINVLMHNSLLQVAWRDDYGNVESCVMHDLVHDIACSILGSSGRVRYMVHYEESSPISEKVAKYLRTLLFEDKIYGNMFADFKRLHVLILADYGCKELPISIRKLIHLRILVISSTRIKYLPDWIGELYWLQTLYADTASLEELPSTLKYLTNLRHLYIQWPMKLTLPAEIGRLTSLQVLEYFKVGDKDGYKIEELGSLKDLKGKLEISNLEMVENKEEAEKASLSNKSKLSELRLTWGMRGEVEATNDENVLEGLQPHSRLKKLVIEGFKGKRFPSWTQNMAVENVGEDCSVPLNKLIEIRLSNCSECEEIPMLGHLPNLTSLELKGLSNVKSINSRFYGLVNEEARIVFPALETLELGEMSNLAGWEGVELSEAKVFPRLKYLIIEDCKQLMSFPNHSLSCLKHLIMRSIVSYKPLANIFKTELTSLTKLWLEGIDDLEYLPEWLFHSNPKMWELRIEKCPNLRGLPDGLCNISSLEELFIRECPKLERIGDSSGKQSQSQSQSRGLLRHVEICECNALAYFPCEILQSSLEKLKLNSLSSLQNLPSLIDFLPKLHHLKEVTIIGVPQFKTTCFVEIPPSFSSLALLKIDVSMGGSMEAVDGILQGCSSSHSLKILQLKGMENWENLPESIQHLNALIILRLENFAMEELPEWLGNLLSLEQLEICFCKKLRRLPSVDAMRRLTRLKLLHISECPEICIEQQSDAVDSQWPKISHIPNIKIDGDIVGVDIAYSKERRRKHMCLMSGCL
ncbi:disease resistance protein RGA2-like [Salvia hispanica]|uniref:disease resistance protein RGA2-like n=1 Tax=Salvia hispanica TaxID=49212 RepID=UPI0020097CC2|nr:disease resistance protein RGA2-like [Salvia hispanica]